MSSVYTDLSTFEWRVATTRWRWLILGSVGVVTAGCWGQAGGGDSEPEPGTLPAGSPPRGTSPFHICDDPQPLGGGWQRCANGLNHRPEGGECTSQLPRAQVIDVEALQRNYARSAGELQIVSVECRSDSDCAAAPHGYCQVAYYDVGQVQLQCEYGCVADSDCAANEVCECAGLIGSCVAAPCRTDTDCAGDGMCVLVDADSCLGPQFGCQTPRDECATAADCAAGEVCGIDTSSNGAWRCLSVMCTPGRPFLIDGNVRLAPARKRSDWHAALPLTESTPDLARDPELRAAVSRGWLQQALMEHASVAAFARFSLQLLSLGAPAELMGAAAQAQADEIAHARDCFALARRYGAGDIGPGPLPLGGALDEMELSEVVLGTLLEGCIGETVAALEAAEAGSHCVDPTARAVLLCIAEDETRHAQLAWRFVAWALETGPASLRGQVRDAFARELARGAAGTLPTSELDRRLLQHGLLSAELRSLLRARVLREVIAPAADALLSSAGNASRGCAAADVTPAC